MSFTTEPIGERLNQGGPDAAAGLDRVQGDQLGRLPIDISGDALMVAGNEGAQRCRLENGAMDDDARPPPLGKEPLNPSLIFGPFGPDCYR